MPILTSRKHRCLYRVKKSDMCNKNPGSRRSSNRRSRRSSNRKSRRSSNRKSRRRSNRKSRRRSNRRSMRSSNRRSMRSSHLKRYMKYVKCKSALQDKIRVNMREYKNGRYSSRAQAIAVSYSQISRKYPLCKRSLKRRYL